MSIAFLTKDLLFQSRVAGQAKACGLGLIADRTPDRIFGRSNESEKLRLWLIDLTLDLEDLSAVAKAIRERCPHAAIIAFGPHVHVDKLERAAAAGFDRVLTRGQFDHQMPQLIAECESNERSAQDNPSEPENTANAS